MADEWQRQEVGDLIARGQLLIGDGYRAKNEELSSHGLPFARAGNINDGFQFAHADLFPEEDLHRVGNKISEPGDVVFTSKGTVGRFAFVRPDTPRFVYSPQLCFWRAVDKELIEPRFLYYWMFGREFFVQFKGVAGQTDMAEYVSLTDQRRMHVTLPSRSEQCAIAHILGALDDKIELNRQMNETLEAMARAVFKSWFVDFDPVRAKAQGRDPGLPKHLADLFPDSFEDSELGEIPKGWRVGKVGDFAALSRESIDPGAFPKETFDHFSIPAFDEGRRPKPEAGEAIKSNKFLVPPSAVLLSKLNPRIPRVWLPDMRTKNRPLCSTEFLVALPEAGISREFLYSFFSSQTFATVFETLVTGTSGSHQRVKPEGLLAINTVIPGESVIYQFTRVVRPLLNRVDQARSSSVTLAALRDTLLPKLVSGELRVKDAER